MFLGLLRTIPISGAFHERHYNVSAGANAWVKFTTEAGEQWVGVFGSGESSRFYAAVPYGTTAHAAIAVPDRDFVVVANDIEIWAVGRSSDRYASRSEAAWYDPGLIDLPHRVAFDGIILDTATRDEVRGKIWEGDGWFEFRLLLPELQLVRGSCIAVDWKTFDLRSSAP